eukprot:Gb_09587 [translate_table: standard]
MIRLTNTDTPCLGEVYNGIYPMLEKIMEVMRLEEKDESETFYNEIQDIIVKRWNKMTSPLHTLAYALNPRVYHEDILSIPTRKAPNKDKEVSDGYKKAFRKLYPNVKMACDVRMEFSEFAFSQNSYGDIDALIDKKVIPSISWWNYHGNSAKHLQTLVVHILSQVASSSLAERNWSTYGFIHSVKKNKLSTKSIEDLVYIHPNLRLLSRNKEEYKKGPPMN